MGLETGTYISDLVATNPLGTDPKSQGDNHIRLVKATIKASFPNVNGAVNPTPAEFNHLVGVTSGVQSQLNLKATIVYVDAGLAALDAAKAEDSAVVKLTGAQTVAGVKTLSSAPVLSAGLELGHASDTTLARIAAGRVSIEGGEIAKLNASQPFTATQFFNGANPVRLRGTNVGAANSVYLSLIQSDDTRDGYVGIGSGANRDMYVVADGGNVRLVSNGSLSAIITQPYNAAPATTGAQVTHADGSLYDVGMNVMPWLTLASSGTFDRNHAGKMLRIGGSTSLTLTTLASTDTTVPDGAVFNLINSGTGTITIAPGSGVTLERYNGTGAPATGSKTLSQGGVATLARVTANLYRLWGNAGLS